MTLNDLELDGLTEVFNLGVGHAADALSQIAGEAVLLSVPRVTLTTRQVLAAQMEAEGCRRLCAVRQGFSGAMETDAVLMFPVDQSLLLVQMMVGSNVPLEQLGEMEKDALAEIGNILLNGIVGSMADSLNLQFEGSLPDVEQGSAFDVIRVGQSTNDHVLNLQVDFEIAAHEIRGFLAFMLDVQSLTLLKAHLATFLAGAFK